MFYSAHAFLLMPSINFSNMWCTGGLGTWMRDISAQEMSMVETGWGQTNMIARDAYNIYFPSLRT